MTSGPFRLICMLMLVVCGLPCLVEGETLVVAKDNSPLPPGVTADYDTIQAAVDDAGSGDTIQVYGGGDDYVEEVNVRTSSITLEGLNNPIIKPASGNGVELYRTSCTVTGFTIDAYDGIWIYNADDNTITDNSIIADHSGIWVYIGGGSTIADNAIKTLGVDLDGGIVLERSGGSNEITDNTINVSDDGYGIIFEGGSGSNKITYNTITARTGVILNDVSDNTVTGNIITAIAKAIGIAGNDNTVTDNTVTSTGNYVYGVCIFSTRDRNTVSGNSITVTGTEGYGIYIAGSDNTATGNTVTATGGSYIYGIGVFDDGNMVTGNTITCGIYGIYLGAGDNTIAQNCIIGPGFSYTSGNTLATTIDYNYNGATSNMQVGNYWSVYRGLDENIDGIGDTAYSLDTESDPSPMMRTAVGRVYQDSSGTQTGLSGWTVYIDANGNEEFDSGSETSTLTHSDGRYSLPNLAPGTYTVRVQPEEGWPEPTTPEGGSYSVVIGGTINDGSVFDRDFVYVSTISGRAWDDQNADGIQDEGEPGVLDVQVDLLDGDGNPLTPDQMGGLPTTAATDSDGKYSFTVIPESRYRVKFTPPSGRFFSPKDQGGDDTKDSDTDLSTGQTDAIETATCTGYPGWDAGLTRPLISGTVYWDKNGDGDRDDGEPPLSGFTVRISPANGTGADQITTDSTGTYRFINLTAGTSYTVSADPMAGYTQTQPAGGSYDVQNINAIVTGKDFGFRKTVLVVAKFNSPLPPGVTADYDTIQGAVNDAISGDKIQVYGGGDDYVEGVYVRKSSVTLDGINNPVIKPDNGNAVTLPLPSCTITGFTIFATSSPYYGAFGIWIYGSDNIVTGNTITVTGTGGEGFYINAGGNTITDNTINAYGEGIYLWRSGDNNITGNTITSDHSDGILINSDGWGGNEISGNTITSAEGEGISIDAGGNTISDNTITSAEGEGISIDAGGNTISDNTITAADDDGVSIVGGDGNTLTGNTITGDLNGICFDSSSTSSSNTITDNTITGGEGGICICTDSTSSGNTIKDNTITGDGDGIDIYDGGSNTITGNTITVGSAGFRIGCSGNTITGNTITGGDYGIDIWSGGNTIAQNCVIGSGHSEASGNTWATTIDYTYNGATSSMQVGNYWSVYRGPDAGIDGIGDTAYSLGSESDPSPIMRTAVGRVYQESSGTPVGLSGWTVYIDSNGNETFESGSETSTTTNSEGYYSLPNLAPGTYTVRVQPEEGWPEPTTPTEGSYSAIIGGAINDGSVFDLDFVFTCGTISGKAWEDLDADGIQDEGEPGLQGVTVSLLDGSDNPILKDGQPVTALTGSDGLYRFNIDAGSYKVIFEKLQYTFSPKDAGEDDTKDSDVDPSSGKSDPIEVEVGTTHTIDAGLLGPKTVSGVVFEDSNGDGDRDEGEPGLKNWTVRLKKPDSSEETAVTIEDGSYSFPVTETGTYEVSEDLKDGWVQTAPKGGKHSVEIAESGRSGLDFGNRGALFISGTKVFDLNANGEPDEGEPRLSGWEIQLLDSNGTLLQNATTAADGSYNFSGLPRGSYTVTEVLQSGWRATDPPEGSSTLQLEPGGTYERDFCNAGVYSISGIKFNDLDGDGSRNGDETGLSGWTIFLDLNGNGEIDPGETSNVTDQSGRYSLANLGPGTYTVNEIAQSGWAQTAPPGGHHTVTLMAADAEGRDFGNTRLAIFGYKFHDMNGNGQQDDGEPRLPGWEIQLLDNNGAVLQTINTSSEPGEVGIYSFSGLEPGDYSVREVQKNGWVKTVPADEGYDVHLSGRAVGPKVFGNNVLAITGYKFHDLNANGQQDDGEPRLPGWEIQLLDNNGAVLQTVNTSSEPGQEGVYSFSGLEPGDYSVREVQKNGWVKTVPADEGYDVHLSYMAVGPEVFGNRGCLSISGCKFEDINGNGLRDGGEPGLNNWTIRLEGPDGLDAQAATDEDGNYSFKNLPPADYAVSEELKEGWLQTSPEGGSHSIKLRDTDAADTDFGNRKLVEAFNVQMTADPQTVQEGQNLTFTITIDRQGDIVLDSMTTENTLPKGLKFVSSNPGPQSVTENPDGTITLIWTDLSFAAQAVESQAAPASSLQAQSAPTTITVTAFAQPGVAGSLTSTVVVTGSSSQAAIAEATAQACVQCLKACDPVELNKTSELKEVSPGETISYTITYKVNIPLSNVTLVEHPSENLEFLSASPSPDKGTENVWTIGTLEPGSKGRINVTYRVKDVKDLSFDSQSLVEGTGFANSYLRLSTDITTSSIQNSVSLYCSELAPVTASYSVRLQDTEGTILLNKEHGSGTYDDEEKLSLRTENKSISMDKDVSAAYAPTTLGLYRNRSVAYSSRWTEDSSAKNRATGASLSESYRYATWIDRESRMILDENGSTVEIEAEFEGMGHVGILKMPSNGLTPQTTPLFEASEDYTGSFKVLEKADEYGSSVTSEKSTSGTGLVFVDKRVGESQRSHESGTGAYDSEELIETSTNYIAKDISIVHAPMSQTLTDGVSINSSFKWTEGMRSKTAGTSYIGEEYSSITDLDKETVARGLNDMETEAEFSGQARYRAVLERNGSEPEVDFDEVYVGDYSVERRVIFTGVAKYDRPHLNVTKTLDGIVEETLPWGNDEAHLEGEVKARDVASYTIKIENDGNKALGPVYVQDLFPPGSAYIEASVRPSELTKTYVNWTLMNIGIGDAVAIELKLDVSEYSPSELVNRVEVCGGINNGDDWVCASNFSALEVDWMTCCLDDAATVKKTGAVDAEEPNVVWYRLDIQNLENSTRVARIVDLLPQGMVLLNASVEPSTYEDGVVTWNLIEIGPMETETLVYRTKALWSGTFTNRAEVDLRSVDGSAERIHYGESVVTVGEFEDQMSASGWQPPDWGFASICEEACDQMS